MAIWHARPDASHGGSNNGTTYANAWQGWTSIVWGGAGVVGGDTLVLHGMFPRSGGSFNVGAHGASSAAAPVIISGASEYARGGVDLDGAFFYCARNYTEFHDLLVRRTGAAGSALVFEAPTHQAVRRCEVTGAGVTSALAFGGGFSFSGVYIEDNYIHSIGGTPGSSGRGIAYLISGVGATPQNWFIRRNRIIGTPDSGLRITVETAAWDTAVFDGLVIEDNLVEGCGGGIWVRMGSIDPALHPVVYSSALTIRRNTSRRNGTRPGGSFGLPGGISFSGFRGPKCYKNRVEDVLVQGAGIQTAKNIYPLIWDNDIKGVRSGTPLASYQGGFPIDGNGIFLDNLTIGGAAWGNRISDLVSTGITNSGTALSFWEATNATFMGNLAVDCYRGASYGSAIETGNRLINNTLVRCEIGITKIGSIVMAGTQICRNNLLVDCPIGYSIGSNPGMDENYSGIFGSTTPYVGISQGANSIVGTDAMLTPDFRLRPGSPCIAAGIHIADAVHMGGRRLRPYADIGAYRYHPAPRVRRVA